MSLDEFNGLEEGEEQRLWELYVAWCKERGVQPRMSDFTVWLQERQ